MFEYRLSGDPGFNISLSIENSDSSFNYGNSANFSAIYMCSENIPEFFKYVIENACVVF